MADTQCQALFTEETIPSIFVRYLKASTDDERRVVVQAYPSLFSGAVVEALGDARAQFAATMREVREACRMIEAVSDGLQYTGSAVKVQPGEAKALLEEDSLLRNFAASLAALLDARERQGRLVHQPTMTAIAALVPVSMSACKNGASTLPSQSSSTQRSPWFTQPSLVLEVLAFLPTEEIFVKAESVCRSWQTWLFEPAVSRFFWVGCVQREFPQQLQALLKTEGEDLFMSDWRSLAMLCVAESDGQGGVGEVEGWSAEASE